MRGVTSDTTYGQDPRPWRTRYGMQTKKGTSASQSPSPSTTQLDGTMPLRIATLCKASVQTKKGTSASQSPFRYALQVNVR